MIDNTTLYTAVLDYLGAPLTAEELETLHLSPMTMRRLVSLLEAEQTRPLTVCEAAQLEAFKEAAFYLRMGSKHIS